MNRFKYILCFVALINLTIWIADDSKSHALTTFHDDFNGTMLDSEMWSVDARGGYVKVTDGALYLDTNNHIVGDSFPVITANNDLFPAKNNWELTTSLRYLSGPNTVADGIAIYAEESNNMIAYICQQTEWGNPYGGRLYLWDESSPRPTRVWFGDVGSIAHTFTIKRSGDYYNAYVDSNLAGTVFNTAEAGRLVIGNVNYSNESGRWNPLMVDYIDITSDTSSSAIPTPEPGTFLLTISGIIGIFSHQILRFNGWKTL